MNNRSGVQARTAGEAASTCCHGIHRAAAAQVGQQRVETGMGEGEAVGGQHRVAEAGRQERITKVLDMGEVVDVRHRVIGEGFAQLDEGFRAQAGTGHEATGVEQGAPLREETFQVGDPGQAEVGKHQVEAAGGKGQRRGVGAQGGEIRPPAARGTDLRR